MNTEVKIAGVTLKNPVMTASGTFGSGMEYSEFVDLNALGAVVTKGVANVPWPGNPTPRVAETYGGMLNAIGLQGPGVDRFLHDDHYLPGLRKTHETPLGYLPLLRSQQITLILFGDAHIFPIPLSPIFITAL